MRTDEFAARAGVPVKPINYLISTGRHPVTRKKNRKGARVRLQVSQLEPILRRDPWCVGQSRAGSCGISRSWCRPARINS